jgi:hypothetical protein
LDGLEIGEIVHDREAMTRGHATRSTSKDPYIDAQGSASTITVADGYKSASENEDEGSRARQKTDIEGEPGPLRTKKGV